MTKKDDEPVQVDKKRMFILVAFLVLVISAMIFFQREPEEETTLYLDDFKNQTSVLNPSGVLCDQQGGVFDAVHGTCAFGNESLGCDTNNSTNISEGVCLR